MTTQTPTPNTPVEIRELNRLFLDFLRRRLADGSDSLGLPRPIAALLADATDERIGALAAYPQAMFRLDLDAAQAVRESCADETADAPLAYLQLLLLASVRSLSRQNLYAARLYLRLSAKQARSLAELDMNDMLALAARPGLVRCAYVRLSWMWTELFRSEGPDRSRQLILLGLQPNVEFNRTSFLSP